MFKPTITKEWLLATMELEGDGFVNAGGIREETLLGKLSDTHLEEARAEELTGRIHFSTKSLPQSEPLTTVSIYPGGKLG